MKTRYNPNALKNRLLFAVGCVILNFVAKVQACCLYGSKRPLFPAAGSVFCAIIYFKKAKRHIFAAVFAIFKAAERGVCARKSAGLGTGIRAWSEGRAGIPTDCGKNMLLCFLFSAFLCYDSCKNAVFPKKRTVFIKINILSTKCDKKRWDNVVLCWRSKNLNPQYVAF